MSLQFVIKGKITDGIKKYLTTETLGFNDVFKILTPLLIDVMLLALITAFNASMVSSSGMAAISAVNIVDTLNLLILNIIIAIATGGTVVVAQFVGMGDMEKAGKTITQTAISAVLISMTLAAFMFLFASDALTLIFGKMDSLVLNDATVYLMGSALSYPLYAVFQVTLGALRGLQDTKTSMLLSVCINVLNLVLNFVTIQFMGLGILGVSVSAIFSRVVACGLSAFILFGKWKHLPIKFSDFFHMDRALQKCVLRIGVPAGSEQFFFHSGRILTLRFIVGSGLMHITANAIGNSLMNVFMIFGNAIQLGIPTVVGYCMGCGNPEDAKKYSSKLTISTGILYILSIALLLPLTPMLIQFYSPPPEAANISFWLTVICCIGMPVLWPYSFVLPSAMRAAGDATFTSVVALTTMWTVRVALGYVLAVIFSMGAYGVWTAMVVEWGIRGIVFYRRYKGGKWLERKVIQT